LTNPAGEKGLAQPKKKDVKKNFLVGAKKKKIPHVKNWRNYGEGDTTK